MNKFTLDEIYGPLDKYLKAHNMTAPELIDAIDTDISLLGARKAELATCNIYLTTKGLTLYTAIDKLYNKKLAHKKRIQDYIKTSRKLL